VIELANTLILPGLDAVEHGPLERQTTAFVETFRGVVALCKLRLGAWIFELVDERPVLEALVVRRALNLVVWAGVHVRAAGWVEAIVRVERVARVLIAVLMGVRTASRQAHTNAARISCSQRPGLRGVWLRACGSETSARAHQQPVTFCVEQQTGGLPVSCSEHALPHLVSTSA